LEFGLPEVSIGQIYAAKELAQHKHNLFSVKTGTTIITEGQAFLYTRESYQQ
jgi:hypothetical protein